MKQRVAYSHEIIFLIFFFFTFFFFFFFFFFLWNTIVIITTIIFPRFVRLSVKLPAESFHYLVQVIAGRQHSAAMMIQNHLIQLLQSSQKCGHSPSNRVENTDKPPNRASAFQLPIRLAKHLN